MPLKISMGKRLVYLSINRIHIYVSIEPAIERSNGLLGFVSNTDRVVFIILYQCYNLTY